MCQFVLNFLGYASVKYYLNLFTVWKVKAEIKRVNFLLRRSVYTCTGVAGALGPRKSVSL